MAPFSNRLGWPPDFAFDSFVDPDEIDVRRMRTVNPFGLFTMLHCLNGPPDTIRAPLGARASYVEAPARAGSTQEATGRRLRRLGRG